ncbi:MAG TPA: VOC family protein [Planctomycetota bacterium]|nr:VOC family protein [Planctomycetota bacterium]
MSGARGAGARVLLFVLSAVSLPAQAAPGAAAPAVLSVGVTVRDLDASIRFYRDVLQFRLVARTEHDGADEEHLQGLFGLHSDVARLQLGDEFLELTEYLAPRGRSLPEDSRSNDLWFQHVAIIVRDMDAAYAELRRHGVRHASPRPQTLPDWNPNAAGIRAFYFQDPDGHALEVLQFPPDKGAAKWHRDTEALFLGIDHTAIVVADTEASLRFWRDELGLEVVGHSDNHGLAQERLNNVFGARLAITTLRGQAGPGVELLEYVTPRTGRAMPADTVASDLWQWVVMVRCTGLDARVPQLARAAALVSSKAVSRPDGAERRLLARDPDGHRAMLVEASAATTARR